MSQRPHALITSFGACLPDKVLTNSDLEKLVETTHDWIVSRTGIEERRIASDSEFTSTLGTQAALQALHSRQISAVSLDAIIVTTMTPDYLCPSTACIIQHEIGAPQAAAFDIQAACSGFLYGLSIAKSFIESNMYKRVLVISSEKNSAFIDYTDRNTCILFGDGAGACIVESQLCNDAHMPSLTFEINSTRLGADGSLNDLIMIAGGGSRLPVTPTSHHDKNHFLRMNGREVFKHAVRRMEQAAKEALAIAQVEESCIRWLIPHQANMRIIEALAKRFAIPLHRVATTIAKYANTSASTIPIAVQEIIKKDEIVDKDVLLLVAFGGGLTWGACVLTAHKS